MFAKYQPLSHPITVPHKRNDSENWPFKFGSKYNTDVQLGSG